MYSLLLLIDFDTKYLGLITEILVIDYIIQAIIRE